jgi:hypothetical protein
LPSRIISSEIEAYCAASISIISSNIPGTYTATIANRGQQAGNKEDSDFIPLKMNVKAVLRVAI